MRYNKLWTDVNELTQLLEISFKDGSCHDGDVEQAEEKLNEEIQWTHWKRVHGPLTHIDSLK